MRAKLEAGVRVLVEALQERVVERGGDEVGGEGVVGRGGVGEQEHRDDGDEREGGTHVDGRGNRQVDRVIEGMIGWEWILKVI